MTRWSGPALGALVLVALALAISLDAQTVVVPGGAPPIAAAAGPGTGLVAGRVLDGENGSPIAAAIVALSGFEQAPTRNSPRVLTDDNGRFFFSEVPAGRHSITASKPGWLEGAFGRTRPAGGVLPVEVSDTTRRADLVIPLWRHGILSGRVIDEAADPLVGTDVRVFQSQFVAGRRHWTFVTRAITDDRGQYRFSSLLPGDYLVVVPGTVTSEPPALRASQQTPQAYLQTMTAIGVAPMMFQRSDVPVGSDALVSSIVAMPRAPTSTGSWLTFPTTLFPTARSPRSASVVRVQAGREQSGIDVTVRFAETFQVAGTLTGPEGTPAAFHALHLLAADSVDNPLFDVSTAVTDATGAFVFHGVPVGEYVARVIKVPYPAGEGRMAVCGGTGAISFICLLAPPPGQGLPLIPVDPLLHADRAVSVVNANVSGLAITLAAGARVSGRAVFEGSTQTPMPTQLATVTINLEPANGRSSQPPGGFDAVMPGRLSPERTFTTPSTWPGRYVIRAASIPSPWRLTSATHLGRDVLNVPVDLLTDLDDVVLTFSDRALTINGSVTATGAVDQPVPTVLLFPVDPDHWVDYGRTSPRLRSTLVSNGAFTMPAPPAGEYFLIAIPDAQAHHWQDPAVLARLARMADRIRVEGDTSLTHRLSLRRLP